MCIRDSCYACGECSAACPRDAGPGDFMAAARKFAIAHHEPTGLTRLLFTNSPFAVVFTVLLAVVMQLRFPRYLSGPNVEVMLINFIPEAIMALGMSIIMITGGIDISVGAVLQFSAIVAAMLMRAGVPVLPGCDFKLTDAQIPPSIGCAIGYPVL